VLKEIYEKYHGISFLTKHFQKDSEKLIAVLDGKYTKEQRNEDIENLKLDFTNENYADDYLKKISKMKVKQAKEHKLPIYKFKKKRNHVNKIQKLDRKRDLYEQLKKTAMFKLLLNNNIFFNRMKKMYNFRKERLERKLMEGIEPD
ncbi:glycosyl transferase family 1, partial [Staphylococcus gallinarum]